MGDQMTAISRTTRSAARPASSASPIRSPATSSGPLPVRGPGGRFAPAAPQVGAAKTPSPVRDQPAAPAPAEQPTRGSGGRRPSTPRGKGGRFVAITGGKIAGGKVTPKTEGTMKVAAAASDKRRPTTASIPARSSTESGSSQRRTTARAKSAGSTSTRSGSGTSRAAANKTTAGRAATRSTGKTAATPARPAPSRQVKTTPAKTTPAKTAVPKTAPSKTAKATPTKATPTRTAPAKDTPAKATPTKTAATKATPSKAAPTRTATTKATPSKAAPSKATPSEATATRTTAAKAPATKAAATKSAATKSAATKPAPSKSTRAPAKSTPTKAAPARTAKATPPPKSAQAKATPSKAAAPAKPVPEKSATIPPTAPTAPAAPPPPAAWAAAAAPITPAASAAPAAPAAPAATSLSAPAATTTTHAVAEPTGPVAEVAAAQPDLRADLRADTAEIPRVEQPDDRPGGIVTPTLRPPVEELREPEPDPVPGFGYATPGAPLILPPADPEPAPTGTPYGREPLTPGARKALQRRRLVALIAFVLLAVIVLLIGQFVRGDDGRKVAGRPATTAGPAVAIGGPATEPNVGPTVTTAGAATTKPSAAGAATAAGQAPADTANTAATRAVQGSTSAFTFVAGYGPVLGTSGTLRRFKVSVEKTIGQGNGGEFADEIDRTLGDDRGWPAGRQFRLQRVPAWAASEFTVYLAAPKTTQRMCNAAGLRTDGFTSCRLPGQVIINDARWQDAVPDYDAPLETYRAYALNHEVGHQLGYGHEGCPGRGKPAPVMMQQTYGLKGCVANAWPFIDGRRYAGPPTA